MMTDTQTIERPVKPKAPADGRARARESEHVHPLVQLGKGLTARIMTITPALAAQWLAKNPRVQRNLGQPSVDMISRAIDEGGWQLNGATIVFGSDGRLYDGQHRLAACVRSGRPIEVLVVWGVVPAAFDTMDVGRARSPSQLLASEGYPYVSAIAGAAGLLWRLDHGYPASHRRMSDTKRVKIAPQEILAYVRKYPELRRAAGEAQPVFRKLRSTTVPTLAYFLMARRDRDAAGRFFDHLATGADLPSRSPILALRERAATGTLDHGELLHWFVIAWNAWRTGSPFDPRHARYDPAQPLPALS